MKQSEKLDKLIVDVAEMKVMLNGHLHDHEKHFKLRMPILIGVVQLAATVATKLIFK